MNWSCFAQVAYCIHVSDVAKSWKSLIEASGISIEEDASSSVRVLLKRGEATEIFRWVYAIHSPYHGAWSIVVGICLSLFIYLSICLTLLIDIVSVQNFFSWAYYFAVFEELAQYAQLFAARWTSTMWLRNANKAGDDDFSRVGGWWASGRWSITFVFVVPCYVFFCY